MPRLEPSISMHDGDLPENVSFGHAVAVDSETMGLNVFRDRLCLVQVSAGDGTAHLVRIPPGEEGNAARLKALMADPQVLKIFHFARFDMAVMAHYLGAMPAPVYCTKIASKLARTYTDRHGLKDVVKELTGQDLDKEKQSSDWGHGEIGPEQMKYAANDVLYLHDVRERLDQMLVREGRAALARACFDFLPSQARLDLEGFGDRDMFAHS